MFGNASLQRRRERRCSAEIFKLTRHCLLCALHKYPGEVLAMCIEDNQPQDCHDECQNYTSRVQEQVIQKNVHDYWSQQHKTEGHEAINKQQRTACDL